MKTLGNRSSAPKAPRSLKSLRNVGPKFLEDLALLGIMSVPVLARCNPLKLYRELEKKTGARQDPCVLDTFMAIVHEAKTGEALDWWKFTTERKRANGRS